MEKSILKEAMRLMGSKGGKKGAAAMTPEQRKARARKAARARWKEAKERK